MKKLYSISITAPQWAGCKYALSCGKNYGNMYGSTTEYKSKELLIAGIKKMIKSWESFDSLLDRECEKVTLKNTDFENFTTDITLAEILGNSSLASWY